VLAGLGTALVTGILFGVLPARRAARLDPVQALARR
jgi:putative ABC transport system permease protein